MLGATFIPVYIALYLISNLKSIDVRYLAAAGIGLTFWFFFDTMGDAASLDENYSFYPTYLFGGFSHFALIAAFAAGVAALAILDHYAVTISKISKTIQEHTSGQYSRSLFLIPLALAIVMGIHGLGEGWDTASVAASSSTTSLVDTFGSLPALISYPIHKFLEGGIIAIAYTCYVSRSASVKSKWWDIPLLGVFFAGTSIVGVVFGYFVSFDTSYFYAFGVTAALYAALRLVEPIRQDFRIGVNAPSYYGYKIFLSMAIGFFLLYSAALLH